MKQAFTPRTGSVSVPALVSWFEEGDEPLFTVCSLSFEQLSKADAMADNSGAMIKLMESLQAKNGKEIGEGIRDAFGVGLETPPNMVKRINHLIMGSVEPVIDEEMAVKLACTFPIEFTQVTNKIIELTGKGYEPGKPQGCTATPK